MYFKMKSKIKVNVIKYLSFTRTAYLAFISCRTLYICVCMCVCVYTHTYICVCAYYVTSVLSDSFSTPWTVGCQAPLSIGFSQARILEQVAISSSRGSS